MMIEQTKSGKLHIGFIGVGVMGRPMVSNLLKAGFLCTMVGQPGRLDHHKADAEHHRPR